MSAQDDAMRSARQLSSAANQLFAQNRELQKISDRIGKQLLAYQANMGLQADIARVAASLSEPMRLAAVEAAKTLQTPVMMQSVKIVDAFQENMRQMVIDFPRIADSVAVSLPPIHDFRPMLEGLESIRLPRVTFSPELLATFRARAHDSLQKVAGAEREALVGAMESLEEIDDAADAVPTQDARPNVFLVLAVLAIVFQFLANQREILETAFEDAAFLGAALTHVWQYAIALLLVLLAYEATKRDS